MDKEYETTSMFYTASDQKTIGYRQGIYNADRTGDFCMFIFLHGAGERGSDNKLQLKHIMEPLANYLKEEKIKCVVLLPQCPANEQWVNTPWTNTSHTMPETPSLPMRHVIELLDSKIAEFRVDTERIYICGISMGGYGTWDLLCRRPEFFAAGMPVCGGVDCEQVQKLKKVPLTIYHGENDEAVPVCRSRNAAEALKKAGNTCFKYVEIPGAPHDVWTPCFQERKNFEWMFSQRRGEPSKNK